MKDRVKRLADGLVSLELTVACLSLLLLLVALCTLEQVRLGTAASVDKYFRSFFLYAPLPFPGWRLPVFPAGGMVGTVMIANLVAVLALRLRRERRRLGLWLIHLGLILLVAGEYVAGSMSVEMRMTLEEGRTADYIESPGEEELAIVESSADGGQVYGVRESALRRGRVLRDPRLPFELMVRDYHLNAALADRAQRDPAPLADQGLGPMISVRPLEPAAAEGEVNNRAAAVEPIAGGRSLGVWLVSSVLEPQSFEHGGKRYALAMRPRRENLPFSLTLEDFRHDVYPGTEIPKNFSSQVRVRHPAKGEDRGALIYMNHPLRYEGKAFYQASYGKNDTVSILQVVENPGWLLPYFSFALMALGLALQFMTQVLAFKAAASPAGRRA